MGRLAHTEAEKLLIDTFECIFDDVGGFPFIFSAPSLNPDNKKAVLTLVHSGEPLAKAMGRYVALVGADSEVIRSSKGMGKSTHRYQAVTGALQCLLGMPEYKEDVQAYILENLEFFTRISKGMFGHNYGSFDRVLMREPGSPISNFCRNNAGDLLSPQDIDRLVIHEHDAHALIVSTVANRDRLGIEQLLKSVRFTAFLPHSDALAWVGDLIRKYPAWNLKPAFGPLFEVKTNAFFMSETKRLLNAANSTKEAFRDAFWSCASPQAVNQVVSDVLGADRADIDSASNCLQVFAENGVDFYQGLVQARQGLGAMLDAQNAPFDQKSRNLYVLESYLTFSQNGSKPKFFGALLIHLPVEDLAAHPESTKLLFERYRLTLDKTLLKAGDKIFNGMVLNDALGL
jgi:hypothetical protein